MWNNNNTVNVDRKQLDEMLPMIGQYFRKKQRNNIKDANWKIQYLLDSWWSCHIQYRKLHNYYCYPYIHSPILSHKDLTECNNDGDDRHRNSKEIVDLYIQIFDDNPWSDVVTTNNDKRLYNIFNMVYTLINSSKTIGLDSITITYNDFEDLVHLYRISVGKM